MCMFVEGYNNTILKDRIKHISSIIVLTMSSSLQTTVPEVYLVSTISEWLVATSVLTFALTFMWDFRALVMETPRVNVNFELIEVCVFSVLI